MADPVEMRLLHMVTADPARTPTLTYFALPQYFLFAGAPNCNAPCITQQSAFAWSHGDIQSDITKTWLGMVGPGVRPLGATNSIWSDHTDIRPTILALLGLQDDYQHDGRVLIEALNPSTVSQALTAHSETVKRLGAVYKQLNAAVGEFGMATLAVSTRALSSSDDTYNTLENQLSALGSQRDAVASQIKAALDAAAFNNQALNEQQAKSWIARAQSLIDQADALAAGS
jgi:arylsulfatase A-like enzyme